MKRMRLAQYTVATIVLVVSSVSCSPLAQSIPKRGQRGTYLTPTLGAGGSAESVAQHASPARVHIEPRWVDVSRYRPSPLATARLAEFELTDEQLNEWVLNRSVVAFRLPEGESLDQVLAIFRIDLSQEQINRAEIPQIQVEVVPHAEQPNHWLLRFVTGKESAVLELFRQLRRVTLWLGSESGVQLHPASPEPRPTPETGEE